MQLRCRKTQKHPKYDENSMHYELCIIHYALIKKGGSVCAVPFLLAMFHIQITDDTLL